MVIVQSSWPLGAGAQNLTLGIVRRERERMRLRGVNNSRPTLVGRGNRERFLATRDGIAETNCSPFDLLFKRLDMSSSCTLLAVSGRVRHTLSASPSLFYKVDLLAKHILLLLHFSTPFNANPSF